MTPSELHNKVSKEALNSIVKPMIESNAKYSEIIVVLESVNVGVISFLKKANNLTDAEVETVFRFMIAAIRQRINK